MLPAPSFDLIAHLLELSFILSRAPYQSISVWPATPVPDRDFAEEQIRMLDALIEVLERAVDMTGYANPVLDGSRRKATKLRDQAVNVASLWRQWLEVNKEEETVNDSSKKA